MWRQVEPDVGKGLGYASNSETDRQYRCRSVKRIIVKRIYLSLNTLVFSPRRLYRPLQQPISAIVSIQFSTKVSAGTPIYLSYVSDKK